MRVKSAAFNWSDEELLNELDVNRKNITVKSKYDKKNKSALNSIKSKIKFGSQEAKKHLKEHGSNE